MKKILFVVSTLRSCGPINQLYGIVSNLDDTFFEAKILTLSPEPNDGNSIKPKFENLNLQIDSLNMSRLKFELFGHSQLENYISEYNPDIVHSTGVRVDQAVSKTKVNNKKVSDYQVMSIRNFAEEDYKSKFGKTIGSILSKLTLKTIDQVNFPVCCSYSLKEKYKTRVNSQLMVVQNGVDVEAFKPLASNEMKVKLRERLGLPIDKRIYIVVGSLIERKNPSLIIESFIKSENNGFLLFLGDGPLMEKLKESENDSIKLLGNVSNVKDYLSASDVYISSSKSEGLPNSVLEAARVGLKLILSDISEHREIFMHTERKFADFFNVNDINELAKLLKTNQQNYINNEQSIYIENHFSTEQMSKKYQIIYKHISKS